MNNPANARQDVPVSGDFVRLQRAAVTRGGRLVPRGALMVVAEVRRSRLDLRLPDGTGAMLYYVPAWWVRGEGDTLGPSNLAPPPRPVVPPPRRPVTPTPVLDARDRQVLEDERTAFARGARGRR